MDDIDEFMTSLFMEMDEEELTIFNQSLIEAETEEETIKRKSRKEHKKDGK